MIDASAISDKNLSLTARLMCDQAQRRGWKILFYQPDSFHVRAQRPDGRQLELFGSTPPTTSFIAAHRSDNKYITHLILHEAGLPLAKTFLVRSLAEIKKLSRPLFSAGKAVVVKPHNGAHGHGVTVDVKTPKDLKPAFDLAAQFSNRVILQEQIENAVDIRILCINFRYAAAMIRIPARVLGDGEHLVGDLIIRENRNAKRGVGYSRELSLIDLVQAKVYLGERINEIAAEGEWVQVVGTANFGTGGETQDVTDKLPAWLISQAEKAAVATNLPCCGVDVLLISTPTAHSTKSELQPTIIEVNRSPALSIHETPTHGRRQPVIGMYLDYLETL